MKLSSILTCDSLFDKQFYAEYQEIENTPNGRYLQKRFQYKDHHNKRQKNCMWFQLLRTEDNKLKDKKRPIRNRCDFHSLIFKKIPLSLFSLISFKTFKIWYRCWKAEGSSSMKIIIFYYHRRAQVLQGMLAVGRKFK